MTHTPLRPCTVPGCQELVVKGRCDKHKHKTQDTPKRLKQARFYKRKHWRRARARKLNEQPLCQECLRRGRTTPAVDVHHKVKRTIDDSLSLDLGNLEALCKRCHAIESAKEREEGGRVASGVG